MGWLSIDVLVNNAAVTYFRRSWQSFSEKHFQLMFGVQDEASAISPLACHPNWSYRGILYEAERGGMDHQR